MNFSKYHFVYNASAYFAAAEKYPDGIMQALTLPGKQGFEALCWALEELSTQGELVRRHMGEDRAAPIKAEIAARMLMPHEIADAKNIVFRAIIRGVQGPTDDEVDEVIAENLKKKEPD